MPFLFRIELVEIFGVGGGVGGDFFQSFAAKLRQFFCNLDEISRLIALAEVRAQGRARRSRLKSCRAARL